MIDSKRLIEVMPRLSGNEYKVFLYILYGYDMARNAYKQAYYERSQSEITKDTGVKISSLKRAIAELEKQKMITCERAQKGPVKARTKYYILDYETYTVQNDHSNPFQNGLSIKERDIERETANKTVLSDLKPLYDKSNQLGDMLGLQATIDGINRIKDEFIKLWDEGKALYKYEDRYQADKDKNWEAFRKRYDGVKSRINRQASKTTPKQKDKKDKRDFSNLNGGGGALSRKRSEVEWDMQSFNLEYAEMPFNPAIFTDYLNSLKKYLKGGYYLDKDQLDKAILSIRGWIEKNWVDGVEEMSAGADKDGEIMLTKEQWKEYARRMVSSCNVNPINPPAYITSDDDVF